MKNVKSNWYILLITELCKTMLRQGLGVAFTVHPSSGLLQPFSEQMIEITSYSDMWGEYNDTLICRVNTITIIICENFKIY